MKNEPDGTSTLGGGGDGHSHRAGLLTPNVLKVGIWDRFWRKLGHDPDPSITYYQPAPLAYGFEWVDLCDDPARVDVVMASVRSGPSIENSAHPRRILYLQETREAHPAPPVDYLRAFDLVLSHDATVLDALPGNARYMTLLGIRLPPGHYEAVPPKTRGVSLMGRRLGNLSGHRLRWRVYETLTGVDAFGFDGRPYWKSDSLASYRFQIAIENARYAHWCTEKLWDAFALETVPIYWGGVTDAMLARLGFRPDGILRWDGDVPALQRVVDEINECPDACYGRFAEAIAHNRRRVLELPCGEVALKKVICDYFDLA